MCGNVGEEALTLRDPGCESELQLRSVSQEAKWNNSFMMLSSMLG